MYLRIPAVFMLAILLTTTISQPVCAQTMKEFQATEKARANILKLGVGPSARVLIKLRDKTEVRGFVSEAGQDTFTVTDSKSGATQKVSYADVVEVRKPGGGPSTRTWLIVGGAAAAAVVVGIIAKPAFCDGGAQTRFPC